MKKVFLFFFILFFLAIPALSQTEKAVSAPTPSPTPRVENDPDVIRISANLIQIDAMVKDSKGNVVTDLKPEDFEIYENGRKQSLTTFSFIDTASSTVEKQIPSPEGKKGELLTPPPAKKLNPADVKRAISLVIDDLNLSAESVYYLRRALKKYVEEQMLPNDLVAILRTSGSSGVLQQFTSDKDQLLATIERIRWYPAGKAGMSGIAAIEADNSYLTRTNPPPNPNTPEARMEEINADKTGPEFDTARKDFFTVGTLGSVNYFILGMKQLPGRKSVILFTDGFSLIEQGANFRRTDLTVKEALKNLADTALRSGVVIYTMDTRGLQPLHFTATDNTSGMTDNPMAKMSQDLRSIDDRGKEFNDNQDGPDLLATMTGGFSVRNTNDLNGGIRSVLNEQKGYYLLGYQPDGETFDPAKKKFNNLDIKVKRPGLTVRCRSGFFSLTDEENKPASKAPAEQLANALFSPFSTNGIALRLTPVFMNADEQGSLFSTLVHINASDLQTADEPDGRKKVTFDIVVIAYDENGAAVNNLYRKETMHLPKKALDQILKNGFVYSVPFRVKKPGPYQLRVAVRDAANSRIGSASQFVEVPDLKKRRLTLSGIILKNTGPKEAGPDLSEEYFGSVPIHNTAFRKFRAGTSLIYGFVVFNAKVDAATGLPKLRTQVSIFQNNRKIRTAPPIDQAADAKLDRGSVTVEGAIGLDPDLTPGEYMLQIVVTDLTGNQTFSNEWLDFEIVK